MSDGSKLEWSNFNEVENEPNIDFGFEACAATFFWPGSEDDWIAVRCMRNGQIICQN